MRLLLLDFLWVLLTSCSTVACQLLAKRGLTRMAPLDFFGHPLASLGAVLTSPWIVAGVAVQAAGFAIWLTVIARANLTWAVGVAGSLTLLLTALLNWALLGQRLSPLQGFGVLLLAAGIALLSTNPGPTAELLR